LTPLAAIGLTIIMVGAVATTLPKMGVAGAALPFIIGVLTAIVAIKRWHWLKNG
jgi:energy-converting hydrogenase Eha subunit A